MYGIYFHFLIWTALSRNAPKSIMRHSHVIFRGSKEILADVFEAPKCSLVTQGQQIYLSI